MDKIKVIMISPASYSLSITDFENNVYRGWDAQVAYNLEDKKDLEIECWVIERRYKKEKQSTYRGIKFRVFPSELSIRHGMELSLQMIKNLIKEAENRDKKIILHIHEGHTWMTYLILFFLGKFKNIKIMIQHHGGRNPFDNLKKYKRLFLILPLIQIMQLCEHLLFRRAKIFYALSDSEISYLKNMAPLSKIAFQTMGIEDKYFKKPDKKKARKKLNFNPRKKYVLYIGRIKSTKGIWELVDSAKALENVNFMLIGQGPDSEKVQDYIKKNNIRNIFLLGPIHGDLKLDYLSACDCLVLPSYTEGAPVVLMEAIAKNLPVVATDVGGITKMIGSGKEGLIIKPKSETELIKAIQKILLWKNKNVSKYSGKYKWKEIIKNTYNDYILLSNS